MKKLTNEMMEIRKIGVEIEMTGITRSLAAGVLKRYFDTEKEHTGGGYDTYEVKDNEGRTWKLLHDSSIHARKWESNRLVTAYSRVNKNPYKVELVTPILSYKDISTLMDIVKKLEEKGAVVNESCGIHIHIDGYDLTAEQIHNLINIMTTREEIIYKALGIYKSREHYCEKTNKRFYQRLNEKNPKTILDLKRIWYNKEDSYYTDEYIAGYAVGRLYHYDHSRYTHLNLHSLFNKGKTIEFRLFNSTLDGIKIKTYIQFCLAVMNMAVESKGSKKEKIETNNPKFFMRNWLRKMGLNGEEFKDCRRIFMENLEGNTAHRFVNN